MKLRRSGVLGLLKVKKKVGTWGVARRRPRATVVVAQVVESASCEGGVGFVLKEMVFEI